MKTREQNQDQQAINLGFIVICLLAFIGAILG